MRLETIEQRQARESTEARALEAYEKFNRSLLDEYENTARRMCVDYGRFMFGLGVVSGIGAAVAVAALSMVLS